MPRFIAKQILTESRPDEIRQWCVRARTERDPMERIQMRNQFVLVFPQLKDPALKTMVNDAWINLNRLDMGPKLFAKIQRRRTAMLAQESLPFDDPDDKLAAIAKQWFRRNARRVAQDDIGDEVGFLIYLEQGKVKAGALAYGRGSEVEVPDPPPGAEPLAMLHTHPTCSAELSDFDEEEGQKAANERGHSFILYVVGLADDGESVTMVEEEFEPNQPQQA